MTTEEFSNEFDTLILVYALTATGVLNAIAFDEYEKSLFLTKAEEQLVTTLYNGKNASNDSFESTEEMRSYLNKLIDSAVITTYTTGDGVSTDSKFFQLPSDLWFIVYEEVRLSTDNPSCMQGANLDVKVVLHDEYSNASRNPFRKPNTRKALRLDIKDNIAEIITEYNVASYFVRYMRLPKPIILCSLSDDLSINGSQEKTECELNPAIHRTILDLAVKLAIASRGVSGK